MLLQFNQFILKEGVRSPVYLLNPPLTKADQVQLPKLSVLHYLDIKYDTHFPTRKLPYLLEVSNTKKIPIHHITDLLTAAEVGTLLNKTAQQEIRNWQLSNTKDFKKADLLTLANKDSNVISVFNYNILKDLYKYKTSMVSNYYKHYNLYTTYWSTIKEAVKLDNESYHFASIEIPPAIPNYNLLNIILKFSPAKFSRVVTDPRLSQVIDIYRWLNKSTRQDSTLKNITDEESKRIVLEFTYKGYSTFIPLHILASLSQDSTLESKTKMPESKLQRLFIVSLYKLQNNVTTLIEEENKSNKEVETKDVDSLPLEDVQEDEELDHKSSLQGNISHAVDANSNKKLIKHLDSNINMAIDTDLNLDNDVNKLLDFSVNEVNTDFSDELFEDVVTKVQHEKDIEESTQEEQQILTVNYTPEHTAQVLNDKTTQESFDNHIQSISSLKLASSADIRSIKKVFEARKTLASPYKSDTQIDDFKVVTKEDTALTDKDSFIPIENPLVDDDLKKELIMSFDNKYLKTTLRKDIISCVTNLEKAGVVIKNYEVDIEKTALGNYEIHKLTLKPLDAKESTVYFRLPIIDDEGEFYAGAIKLKMRKQKTDNPIRKISPTRVALTSNYSKLFIFKTDRKAFDNYAYIVNYIKESYIEGNSIIKAIIPGDTYNNNLKLPNDYTALSKEFKQVTTDKYTFIFDNSSTLKTIDEKTAKDLKTKNLTFVGYTNSKEILVMDYSNAIYNYSNNQEELGSIVDLLEIDQTKLPTPFTMIKILGDDIPLGVALSYYIGLSDLISVTNTKFSTIESKKQFKPNKNQTVIKFLDYKLILETPSLQQKLLFNGFFFFKDFTKQYNLQDFDDKNIYLNLLEERDFSLIHIKELNLLQQLFLDPITVDVLSQINEPTDYLKLLMRANELLEDLSHPDINDPAYSRIRGYDRVPGLMYRALAESIRTYKFKSSAKSKIELDPYKVWNYVTQDNTVKISEDNNPVLDVKEMETVTFTGNDGLNKDATPKLLRNFHKNDMGLISEGTVDSSDVALNIYLSPYAKLKNTRGLVDIDNQEHVTNPAKNFSTSVLLAPMAEYDDPKRVNFIQIQNGHTIASAGYQQPLLRTGYEYVMPYKVGKLYCSMAKQNGIVVEKTDKLITIKYEDNTTETVTIGTLYGKMEGSVFPHVIITDRTLNQKLKQGDYIAYNTGFFEKDWLDPTRLIMKFGKLATIALTMTNEVFEDSSAISSKFSKEMSTTIVKEKSFVVEFSKNIINLIPEQTPVAPNDILFTLTDENLDYNNLSDSTIEMLQGLANTSPKAKVNGVIDKYEVIYNGDVSDMSPSLRKLVTRLDKSLYDSTKGTQYELSSNRVNSEYRVEGKNLNIDTLELKVYIKVELTQSLGD